MASPRWPMTSCPVRWGVKSLSTSGLLVPFVPFGYPARIAIETQHLITQGSCDQVIRSTTRAVPATPPAQTIHGDGRTRDDRPQEGRSSFGGDRRAGPLIGRSRPSVGGQRQACAVVSQVQFLDLPD